MSSVIGSTGKFGVSMDCSQRTELRRKYLNMNAMRIANPHNTLDVKPHFNQDMHTRDYGSNGAKEFYFAKGLNAGAYKLAF